MGLLVLRRQLCMAGLLLHTGTLMVCVFMLLLLALEQHSKTFLIFIFTHGMVRWAMLLLLLNLWVRLLLLLLLNRLLLLLLLLLLLGLLRLQHQVLVRLPYFCRQGHVVGAVVAALWVVTLLVVDTSSQINWSSTAQHSAKQNNSAANMSDRR